MRAVLFDESVSVEPVELDPPGPGEVAVRLLAAGVCHSDLYVVETGGWGMPLPVALGHEGCGVVEDVGEGVSSVHAGERVVLAWRAPCGACAWCARGAYRLCPSPLRARRRMRRTADGARVTGTLLLGCFADKVVVHEAQAVPVPEELPPEQACLLGCAVATGAGAVLDTAPVWPGARVAVIGCGGVGLSAIQGARIAGAAEVVAIDREPRKLETALRFGATEAHEAPPDDLRVDFAFDCVGAAATLELAVGLLDHAGIATLVGLPHRGQTLGLDPYDLFARRAQLRVSHGGDHLPGEDFPRLARLALEGELDLAGMVSRTIALDEVVEAFDAMRSGDVIRSVVVLAAG